MSTWTERKITRDLSERDSIEPPEGLLEKLKADLPPDLGSRLSAAALREPGDAEVVPLLQKPRRQRWLMAASLILTVTGGLFAAMVVMRQMQPAEEMEMAEGGAEPESPAPMRSSAPSLQAAEDLPAAEPAEEQPSIGADEQKKLDALGYVAPQAQSVPPAEPVAANESLQESRGDQTVKEKDQDREWKVEGEAISDMATVAPQGEPAPSSPPPPPPPPAPADGRARPAAKAMAPVRVAGVEGGAPGGVVGGVVGGTPGGVVSPASIAEETPSQAMLFESAEPHGFVDTVKDRLSTFGLDVDTGSYTLVRNYLRAGKLPPKEAIRVEELVNYFSYGDPAPARGDFALRAEGAASIFTQEPHTYLLRFNLRAREVKAEHRKPAVLTFVVDVSGSMDQGNRLGLVKQSLGLLLDQLRKDDKVGLVIYGSEARVLLEPTSDREMIRGAIDQLATNGATNAEAGIALGYDVATRSFRPGAINRVLLCSDGVANVGATGPEAILQRIQREARRGIELTTLGFGMGNYNDALMEQLANKGNGRYAYLDDLGEAKRMFVEELTGTLQTIAEDAKAQVEFFPAAVARWRLIGYENRDIPDEKFRDNTVDAGEIGAGHSVTALYEVQLKPEAARSAGKIASLHLRYRVPVTGALQETIKDLRASDLVADWKDASLGFRLASLVVEFAETLRGSSHAEDLRKIQRRLQRVVGEMAGKARGEDVAEFARLVEDAARIREAAGRK